MSMSRLTPRSPSPVSCGARRAPSSGLVALVVTVGLYVLFVRVLRVPLPYGIVEAWLVG